jgi:hypothetical protein
MNRMIQGSVALALLGASSLVFAQTAYDPAIAYTQVQGRTAYLYVANADGTHAVRIASSSGNINGADFAPGGGRIAYTGSDGLRVVSYSASNSGVVVTGVVTLVAGTVGPADFSGDGTRLLYHQTGSGNQPSGFRAVPAAGGTPVLLHAVSTSLGIGHWLRYSDMGNAFAFLVAVPHGPNVPVDYEIRVVMMDGNDATTAVSTVLSTTSQAFKAIDDFDTARTRNALLVTANFPTAVRFVDYDLGTSQLVDRGTGGYRGHYNASDGAIVFRESVKGGNYLSVLDLGSGTTTRLTAKGDFGAVDARP